MTHCRDFEHFTATLSSCHDQRWFFYISLFVHTVWKLWVHQRNINWLFLFSSSFLTHISEPSLFGNTVCFVIKQPITSTWNRRIALYPRMTVCYSFLLAFVTAQTWIGQHIKAMTSTKSFHRRFTTADEKRGKIMRKINEKAFVAAQTWIENA